MSAILNLASRNIKIYIRNKSLVFFSFLSVIIIIGLYALFLGKVQVAGIQNTIGDVAGIRFLVDSWIMSGLLAINVITISLGVLGTMVRDIEEKQFSDFMVAPVSRTGVVLSYLVASWVITFAFSIIALLISEAYIVLSGGALLAFLPFLQTIGVIALCVISSSAVMYLLVTFIKSSAAFATLSTLLGTLIGFITGVYVPLGILPPAVQKFVILVPFSHAAAALRQIFCAQPLAQVFKGAPPEVLANYEKVYGIKLFWGSDELSMGVMLAVLAGTAVVFLLLSALRLRKYKQN